MGMELENYKKKLEKYYNGDGLLTQYPSKRPMRIIVLVKIAEKFETDKKYTEKQVNEIILSQMAFGDIELMRREMFQYKLLGRLRDGSEYWLEKDWKEQYHEYREA